MPQKSSQSGRRLNARGRIAIFALLIIIVAIAAISIFNGDNDLLKPLPFTEGAEYQFISTGVLYIDSNVLKYDDLARGKSNWSLGLTGEGFRISTSDSMIVVYNDRVIQALSLQGENLFPGLEFTSEIIDVRCGIDFIAVLRQDASGRHSISIIKKDGNQLNPLTFEDSTPVDFAFYSTTDKLWTLSIDTEGASPISTITTYNTGEAITGIMPVDGEIIYKIHIGNPHIYAIGTNTLHAFTGTGNEDLSKQVYGWQLMDSLTAGENNYFLLQPRNHNIEKSSNAKLITMPESQKDVYFRLPPQCIGAFLYSEKVVVFTHDSEYTYNYKGELLKQYKIPQSFTSAKKLSNNRVLLSNGHELYAVNIH